jgi:hypothetical protein
VQRKSIIALAAWLVLGCGSDSSASEPVAVHVSPDPSGPAPSLAEWLPEGHPAHAGSGAPAHGGALPPGHPPIEGHDEPSAEAPPDAISGTVRETMNAASYTYMQLETDDGLIWIAATQTSVSVGDRVVASGSVMQDFHSNTLDRTFDRLMLASFVRVESAGGS